jgi:hypothetical protein
MVLLQERSQAPSRITLQISEIAANTTVIRSLDWDRKRPQPALAGHYLYLRCQNPDAVYLRCLWDALLRRPCL